MSTKYFMGYKDIEASEPELWMNVVGSRNLKLSDFIEIDECKEVCRILNASVDLVVLARRR